MSRRFFFNFELKQQVKMVANSLVTNSGIKKVRDRKKLINRKYSLVYHCCTLTEKQLEKKSLLFLCNNYLIDDLHR